MADEARLRREDDGEAMGMRLFYEGICTTPDNKTSVRVCCETPLSCAGEVSIAAASHLGLPIVPHPDVLADGIEFTPDGPRRRIHVAVVLFHQQIGLRVRATAEIAGQQASCVLAMGFPEVRTAFNAWVAERDDAQRDERYDEMYRASRPDAGELARQRGEIAGWERRPKFSIVCPVFRPKPAYLRAMIDSVLAQTYPDFELVLANASGVDLDIDDVLASYDDPRITVLTVPNKSISENTNAAIAKATGDYVAFVDHDDFIEPDTLYRYMVEIREHPECDLLFCNEDLYQLMDGEGDDWYFGARFKGAYSSTRLMCGNTVCHMLVVSRRVIDATERSGADVSGAQDYDLTLKAAEMARDIRCVPYLLYHWRAHEHSTATHREVKPYADEAARLSISRHYERIGVPAKVEFIDFPFMYRTRYQLPDPMPSVTIVVVGRDRHIANSCVRAILRNTDYDRYRVLVAGARGEASTYPHARVETLELEPDATWAEAVNAAVAASRSDIVAVLDQGCRPDHAGWLRELVGLLQEKEEGVVAPMVLDAQGLVSSCGCVVRSEGRLLGMGEGLDPDGEGYLQYFKSPHEVSAVPPVCVALRRSTLSELGGMPIRCLTEAYAIADLCLSARMAGKLVTVTPYEPMTWVGAADVRDVADEDEDRKAFARRRAAFEDADPYLDPALDDSSPYWRIARVPV